jgi:hypothetical protein
MNYVKILNDTAYKAGINKYKFGTEFCKAEDLYLYIEDGTLIADIEIPFWVRVRREGRNLNAKKDHS